MPAHRHAMLALVAVPALALAQSPVVKPEDFVIVRKGTLPVIVSAPHGGRQPLPDIPIRFGNNIEKFVIARDENTAEIARTLATETEALLGGRVGLVVARFERKQIDANRPADGAYESEAAKPFYDHYHAALAAACKAVKESHGRGLLLDIHGQSSFKDAVCRGTQNGKTVKLLRERFGKPAVSGKDSVLGFLQAKGYAVRPAGDSDGPEEPKYTGGHTVGTYGSHTAYGIDAIQLELGSDLRNKDAYAKTAKDIAAAVKAFHDAYLK